MNTTIDNAQDLLDSRDIIERIEELESELIDVFNEQQKIEGFTVSDDSEEIYQAEDSDDELFVNWLSDCRLCWNKSINNVSYRQH